jgi:hypothetical protein
MAGAGNRSTLEGTANGSRRADRASCRSDRDRRVTWRRSLRRTRRAIDSSRRLLDSSRRVIDASERFAARRPLRTSRQLQRVAGWLTAVEARLGRAVLALRSTTDDVARSPEHGAGAPGELIDAAARWLHSAAEMASLSERLDDASSRLLAAAKIGAVTFDLPGLDDPRHASAPSRLITGRLLLDIRLPQASGRILLIVIRYRRSRRIAFADAGRPVFRGRAPPHAAICSL